MTTKPVVIAGLAVLVNLLQFACNQQQEPPKNVTLLAHVNDYSSTGYNDCWGYTDANGREYALLGVKSGTSIIDITDTTNPAEIAFIAGNRSDWKDLKTYQTFAYVVNESGGGIQIIDLADLPNSAALVATYDDIATSHNIYIDEQNGFLYVEGGGSKPVIVLSLANPTSPVEVSTFGVECHDVFVQDGRAFVSEGTQGSVGIFDVSSPPAPALLQRLNIPQGGYAHNAWLTKNGQYLMTTEETQDKTVKLWDIRNLANISITDDYLGSNGLAHNVHIKGDYAYISHYASGLRIVDISDPGNIFEAGSYDTEDAWGTWPYFASGKILISDINQGLYVVRFDVPVP